MKNIKIKLDEQVWCEFKRQCRMKNKSAASVIRDFMQSEVASELQPEHEKEGVSWADFTKKYSGV